jgi:hypothetical protein
MRGPASDVLEVVGHAVGHVYLSRAAADTIAPARRGPRPDRNEHCSLGLNAPGVQTDEQVVGQS